MENNSECPDVGLLCAGFVKPDFWRQIKGRAHLLVAIKIVNYVSLFVNSSRSAYISNPRWVVLCKEDIEGLYVSVNDILCMHVLNAERYLYEHFPHPILC